MKNLIDAHLAHCKAAGLAELTVTKRAELLRRLDRDLPFGLERATVEELADWLARPARPTRASRRRQRAAASLAIYYWHIRGFFRWACNPVHPLLDYDPSAALSQPRAARSVPKPVTTAELELILSRMPGRWRLYALLAAFAGLRCCEIAALHREEITEEQIYVHSKGGRIDAVPTHPLVWQAVRELPPGPIVEPVRGRPATANYISSVARYHLRQAGLPNVSMHRLRHWLGTTSLNARDPATGMRIGNLRKTQELLRHSSPAVTAIYTEVTNEERRAVIHALPIPAVPR